MTEIKKTSLTSKLKNYIFQINIWQTCANLFAEVFKSKLCSVSLKRVLFSAVICSSLCFQEVKYYSFSHGVGTSGVKKV